MVSVTIAPRPGDSSCIATLPRRITQNWLASCPSSKRNSPSAKCTLDAHPAMSRIAPAFSPAKNGWLPSTSSIVCMSSSVTTALPPSQGRPGPARQGRRSLEPETQGGKIPGRRTDRLFSIVSSSRSILARHHGWRAAGTAGIRAQRLDRRLCGGLASHIPHRARGGTNGRDQSPGNLQPSPLTARIPQTDRNAKGKGINPERMYLFGTTSANFLAPHVIWEYLRTENGQWQWIRTLRLTSRG